MNHKCIYCVAYKWKEEAPGMCCQIMEDGFMPTFKVQEHLVGGLLPLPQQEPQFLQIYFIREDEREANLKCSKISGVKPNLVKQLQAMLHEKNSYIRDLKTTLQKVPTDCEKFEILFYKITITNCIASPDHGQTK